MARKRRGFLELPREVALPQDEIELLNEKETTIREDTKNLFKGMDEAVGVGGASALAKVSAIRGSYYKGQSENYLLPKAERDVSFTKYKKNEVDEKKWKETWLENRESVEETYDKINNILFKGTYKIGTGMLADYSDAFNLNLMIGMNSLTQGMGGAVYGASKSILLYTDMALGGLEEASLNFQTQKFMLEKENADLGEVALSGILGMMGETIFPMLGSATGMGYGKVMSTLGGETFDEVSSKLVKEASDNAKMDLVRSKVKNENKYGIGNYDQNIIRDASKIDSAIADTGTITGNLREQGDSIVTINGKPYTGWESTDDMIKDWKENTGGRTLEQEKAILDSIEKELKEITGTKEIVSGIEAELKAKKTGKERPLVSKGELDLKLFTKDQKADKEIAKLFEGKKELTTEELRNRRRQMTEQMERDIIEDEGIAVNDIGVDNAKATSELFTPKKLVTERQFNPIVNEIIESPFMKEIEEETITFNTGVREVTDVINSMSELGELKDIDKINDFIDDYGIEDKIPLLVKKPDGTIDLGNKTPEEFVNDFKIELQLFSDPIDKNTPEAIFKNVTLREATKMVNNSKEILGTLLKKSKEKLGRPLKIKERDTLIKNFIKENLYNSYRYAQNKNMTKLHFNTVLDVDGNRYGATEIFNQMETDGDKGFLGKALFDPKLETKTKGTGLAMNKFIKRFDDSVKLLVDGNFKTDIDNVHSSLLFDNKKLYYDSLDESMALRVTDKNNNLDFNSLSLEEKAELEVFAFDVFQKKNVDLFDKKTARIIWDNFTGHGKSASQLEGTALHQMGEMQRFYDEKVIDKATVRKLAERYSVSDRILYNRMVKTSSNANALYSTFGYKPKTTMNRMFGNYVKANPLTKKSRWLFGEGSQAWTLKTNTNDYANMIFADEIGRTKGQITTPTDRFFNYKARMDSMMLGMTEMPVEIATHMAKRLAIGKEPIHKILLQTVKSVMEVHSLTKKIANEANDTFLKEHVGALGSLYEFMITKGDTDYSGAVGDTLKAMSPKEKAIFKTDKFISKLNFIRQTDLFGDKLALFSTAYDMDKFGKIGYKELMSKSKHNYIASKLDEFGIGEDTFNLMINSKRGEFGIRDYTQYTKKELEIHGGTANIELKKMQDFTDFYTSKIGFTKPDVEFSKAKNVYRSDDDKFLTALNMYWKKTMYTKLKDGGSLLSTMNTYGGLGKTFDFVNVDHYVRLLMGATAIGIGGYGSNKMDEIVYGYELEEAETLTEHIMLIFNQFGAYTLTDQTSLMRSLGQVLNGKTAKAKGKGAVKLVLPSKIVRQAERIIEEE